MAVTPSNCVACEASCLIDWPDNERGDFVVEVDVISSTPSSPEDEGDRPRDDPPEWVEARVVEGAGKHLCAACRAKVEERFRREGQSLEGTLAAVLEEDYLLQQAEEEEAFLESNDPDARLVEEYFPNIELPRPARDRARRNELVIAELLARVGSSVAYYAPGWDDDGPYLIYWLGPDWHAACFGTTFELFEQGPVVCALDFGVNGFPLDAHLKG